MKEIYVDNACTSFPKPDAVSDNVYDSLKRMGGSVNRGSYEKAYRSEEVVFETRSLLCDFFGGTNPRNVVFTKNVTESLNVVLRGFLNSGDKVLVSGFEHNAVMRTLTDLNVNATAIYDTDVVFDCDSNDDSPMDGGSSETIAMDQIIARTESILENENIKAVVMTATDNVFGQIMPIKEIGKICRKFDVKFIVDTAQLAGSIPINMTDSNIDALCFTGHKGLMGPSGIGGFILTDEMAELVKPLITGGTGSVSHLLSMPEFMPDKFEAGTLNLPGIVGLKAGIEWINKIGLEVIHQHEMELAERFINGLMPLVADGKIKIPGYCSESSAVSCKELQNKMDDKHYDTRVSIVSIQTVDKDMAEVAARLDSEYGIMARVGLHCNPSAHKLMGTYPEGTLRFSFGYFNTEEEVDAIVQALYELCYS